MTGCHLALSGVQGDRSILHCTTVNQTVHYYAATRFKNRTERTFASVAARTTFKLISTLSRRNVSCTTNDKLPLKANVAYETTSCSDIPFMQICTFSDYLKQCNGRRDKDKQTARLVLRRDERIFVDSWLIILRMHKKKLEQLRVIPTLFCKLSKRPPTFAAR